MPSQMNFELGLTPAMADGEECVSQCAGCGVLVAAPTFELPRLGPCPVCRGAVWWPQALSVGPFIRPGEARA